MNVSQIAHALHGSSRTTPVTQHEEDLGKALIKQAELVEEEYKSKYQNQEMKDLVGILRDTVNNLNNIYAGQNINDARYFAEKGAFENWNAQFPSRLSKAAASLHMDIKAIVKLETDFGKVNKGLEALVLALRQ